MKSLSLWLLLALPSWLFGQYTYFNNGYMPPHPEIGSGQSIELILRNDSIFANGFAPFEVDNNGRSVLVVDQLGELQETWLYPEGDLLQGISYSDVFASVDNGYLIPTGEFGYPLLIWTDDHFAERFRLSYEQLTTDEISGSFFNSAKLAANATVTVGRMMHDPTPLLAGTFYVNLILTKHDEDGNELWFHEYTPEDVGIDVEDYIGRQFFPQGGIYALDNGEILVFASYGEPSDCFAIKFDSDGNYLDHVAWGNTSHGDGSPRPVQISGQEFMFVYGAYSHMLLSDYYFSPKLGLLNVESMTINLQTSLNHDFTYGSITDFERTPDGGFAMLGYAELNSNGDEFGYAFIIKTDSEGNEEWYKLYAPSELYSTQTAFDLEITPDGGFVFLGNYHPHVEGIYYYKSWIVKTDACGNEVFNACTVGVDDANESPMPLLSVFPNPAEDVITIRYAAAGVSSILLFDATGRQVRQMNTDDWLTEHKIDIHNLPASLYQLRLLDSQGNSLGNLFLIKK